ncbi:MipA/OmpV family protein [Thalassotalea psychrophila]|uniref:MipA/OmpV family protein n=1 Tax=Thalassotalea psychrophila TaxID=3065647 RepID=A0ABY9TWT8_9GAMM|nr:MipA/OmpV family protein [Colwelliaceae bacterium SQ149]
MKYFQLKITTFVCAFILMINAHANQGGALSVDTTAGKPVWEVGVFSAAFRGPIYPAATDYQNKFLPLPFVIYRGEKIRIGDESLIKAIAVEKERFKLDVSLGAAFNADSEDSKIREGMPDLDFMFEIGPEASFLLHDSKVSDTWLNLQFRSVFSTDFSDVHHRGYVFQPEVSYRSDNLLFDNSRFYFSVSPTFASAKTHQYFYDVDAKYVNSERDYYQSLGGYLGTKMSIANRFQLTKSLMVFVGTQLGFWQGAKNDDSDLYQEKFTYAVALGVKWTVFQSTEHIN